MNKKIFLLFFLTTFLLVKSQTTTVTISTTGIGSWTAPCGVTSATIICNGAGGGGGAGNGNNVDGGGGGGGGGCAINTAVTVIGGTSYNYTVGAGGTGGTSGNNNAINGGTTTIVVGTSTITGNGGGRGIRATSGAGGAGGTATGGSAGGNFTGGAGAAGLSGTRSGGGGEGASSNANGTSASGTTGGTGTSGGDGANGGNNGANSFTGLPGSAPGGAGSGANKNRDGGDGGDGQIIIIYTNSIIPANAGTDQTVGTCSSNTTTLAGNSSAGYTGVWTCLSGCGGVTITTPSSPTSNVSGLTGGTNVTLQWALTQTSSGCTSVDNLTITPGCPPSNDDCANAINAAVNTSSACTVLTAGTSNSATQSLAGCSGTADDDVWFSFVAGATSHTITVTPGTITNVVFQLYVGSCGGLTSAGCVDATTGSTAESNSWSGFTIGSTYYIRVFSNGNGTGQGTFSVCITAPYVAPPANDNCSGALAVTVNSGTNCASQTAGTIAGATTSTNTNTCGGSADDDVWFSFVASATSQLIKLNNVSGSTTNLYHSVYAGSCGSLGSPLICGTALNSVVSGLTIGTTYFIRVYSATATGGQSTTFNVCVSSTVTPPTNDNCTSPTPVTVNSSTTCSSQTGGTLVGATGSSDANTCGGIADDDVWYSFTATSTYHQISLNNVAGSTTDLYHSIYNSSCGSLGTPFDCSDPNSSNVNGLTIGNTYFIRVYSTTATWGQTTTFSVCITTLPPPPANTLCGSMTQFCSGSGATYTAQSNGATAAPASNYGCLSTQPNPTWFFIDILTPGNLAVDITAASDVDFAMWGPYSNLNNAKTTCNAYPAPLDCSYSNSATEQLNISNAVVGQVYVVVVTNYANTVQTIQLTQASGAVATTNCTSALPVELISFTGVYEATHNSIYWKTAVEERFKHYELESSSDGINFIKITTVAPLGNVSAYNNYNYLDFKSFSPTTYYRLKMVDLDNSYKYSPIISVENTANTIESFIVYPNPASKELFVKLSIPREKEALLDIKDLYGRSVYQQRMDLTQSIDNIYINTSDFSSGIYVVNLSSGYLSENIKISINNN